MKIHRLTAGLFVVTSATATRAADESVPAVVPQPQSITLHDGRFQINRDTVIVDERGGRETARYLRERLARPTGFPLPMATQAHPGKAAIVLTTKDAKPHLGEEGYELS